MTTTLASLPMYDADRPAVERLWRAIADRLRRDAVPDVPEALCWAGDALDEHWLHPALLLSQTCGYPIVDHLRGRVQLVGTLRYGVPGCEGIRYRSRLVVREDDPGRDLADFRGRTAAYNATDSQSGYSALLALVAPLAEGGRFFDRAVASGAHARSIELVKSGAADIAAIDCISYACLGRVRPRSLAGLRVIGSTGAAPGLPLVTAAATMPATPAALRHALAALFDARRSTRCAPRASSKASRWWRPPPTSPSPSCGARRLRWAARRCSRRSDAPTGPCGVTEAGSPGGGTLPPPARARPARRVRFEPHHRKNEG